MRRKESPNYLIYDQVYLLDFSRFFNAKVTNTFIEGIKMTLEGS